MSFSQNLKVDICFLINKKLSKYYKIFSCIFLLVQILVLYLRFPNSDSRPDLFCFKSLDS